MKNRESIQEYYDIVEETKEYIKIKHKTTSDLSTRYKSYCHSCGKDRGWKKKNKVDNLCGSCLQHKTFINSLDKSKFLHVDFSDIYIKHKKSGSKTRRYRTSCPSCGKDRGYIDLCDANKLCLSCTRKEHHKNLQEEEKIKIAIKISMTQSGDVEFTGFKNNESEKQRAVFKSLNLNYQCFERDNYTCQSCGKRGGSLNAHHLNSWKHFPDQRYELSNLVTLCKTCHKEFHKVYGNGKSSPNTLDQFLIFKKSR